MTRWSYYRRKEALSNEPEMDLGIEIEAHLSKNGCPFIPSICAGYTRCYIKLNASDKLECWLAEGYNVKLGIMKGKDDKYLKL